MKYILKIGLFVVVVFYLSCTKYGEPQAIYENAGDTLKKVKRKVLLIAIDGLSGNVCREIDLPKIELLKANGIYTYDAISDIKTTDAASWMSLMTGSAYGSHNTSDSNFVQLPGRNGKPNYVQSFFNIISASTYSYFNIAAITSWKALQNKLFQDAKTRVLIKNDTEAADSAVKLLKSGNKDIIVVNFNEPAKAGIKAGFTATATPYVNAIKECDRFIGNMVDAINQSPNRNTEDWLVIITGTHGGTNNGYGGTSVNDYNVFTIYNNIKFKETAVVKDNIEVIAEIKQDNKLEAKMSANAQEVDFMNFKNSDVGFTIQFWIKGVVKDLEGLNGYMAIVSKRKLRGNLGSGGSTPGWEFSINGNPVDGTQPTLTFTAGDPPATRVVDFGGYAQILDGAWHQITVSFYEGDGFRKISYYLDGVKAGSDRNTSKISQKGLIGNDLPLIIGHNIENFQVVQPFQLRNLMFFSDALTEEDVKNYKCVSDIKLLPKYDKLKGYYRFDEGIGNVVPNQVSPGVGDIYANGGLVWKSDKKDGCGKPGAIITKKDFQMTNLDIVPNILYWYKIDAKQYALSGNDWLANFL